LVLASLEEAIAAIVGVGRRLDARRLADATSGNLSARLADGRIAITVSGSHKGRLGPRDIMLVDARGLALDDQKPSAETALHAQLYELYPQVNAVVHAHSVASASLTLHLSPADRVVLSGYEMLKAFPGITTHATTVSIPILENSQQMASLATGVARQLQQDPAAPAYLIRGHGAYGWGKDLDEAERIIEALDHLLLCEIESLRLRGGKI
jgi:methylthioribulose-1-phosphate dehydratase